MKPELNIPLFLETLTTLINKELYYYIYCLLDPRTEQVRYVGRTLRPTSRLFEHGTEAERAIHKNAKQRWLCELDQEGQKPKIKFLELCKVEQAETREQHWIDFYMGQKHLLLNTCTTIRVNQRYKRRRELLGYRVRYKTAPAYTAKDAHNLVFQNIVNDLAI
jgi:hypothetical protein